jgi:hypothetical protein
MKEPTPQTMQISVFDIANLRVALEQIKEPSKDIIDTIIILDDHILTFARSLQKGN